MPNLMNYDIFHAATRNKRARGFVRAFIGTKLAYFAPHGANWRKWIMRKQTGFTLIEIAIVLVIIGLLLGGVLKGQELITSARVRNLISQQDGVKAAYFGFLDRFRSLPRDYSLASNNIAHLLAAANGNNNGRIETIATAP